MTFERVLIFPHKPLETYCLTGKIEDAGKGIAENLRGGDPGAAECWHRRAKRNGRGNCSAIPELAGGPTLPWAIWDASSRERQPREGAFDLRAQLHRHGDRRSFRETNFASVEEGSDG